MCSSTPREDLFGSVSALGGGLDGVDADGLAERLVVLERIVRRAEAAMVAVLDEADRRAVWTLDGHASVRGWARATVRWSFVDMRDRMRTLTLFRDAPAVAAELAEGRIGVAQVRELARARANPRVGAELVDAIPLLVEHAENLPFAEFRVCVQRWEALADVDGTHQGHEAAHAGRRAHASMVGNTFCLDAAGGAVDGVAMIEILSRFEQAQFDAEWDELKTRYGDDARPALMRRTAGQRRFDALRAIFERAASTAPGARAPEPVVNVIVDQPLYEAWLARLSGDQPDAPLPDPADVDRRRCETVDGVQLDPADVVIASLVGHVRRVVMNRAGVVIEMGRKSRLFTGSAREAAKLQGSRCLWPGCGRPRTQIDHSTDWSHRGPTDPANAGPECGRHNRFKNRGYTVWRDERGRWHTYRPDGTEIIAA
jgi:hypothetical protein